MAGSGGGGGHLNSQEPVWFFLLTQAINQDRQVVVIVELVDVHLPLHPISGTTVG